MDESKLNDVERDLIEGLEGFVKDLKSEEPLTKKYTHRRVELELQPTSYRPGQVKAVRKLLMVSQVLFAQFLGVSVKAVRAWEQGKKPSDIACRFMDEIQRNPDYWRKRLKQSVKIKASK
jgi:putative transcriptional regulator